MNKQELEDLRNIFEKNIKNEEIGINVNDEIDEIFEKEEYKKNLNSNINEYYKSFSNNLKKNVNNNFNENDQNIVKDFDLIISKYTKIYKENQTNIRNGIFDFNDELKELRDNFDNMSCAISELKEAIEAKEFVLKKA